MAGFTALAVDPSRSGIVYAGVRGRSLFGGLVRSPDAGETWPEIVVFPPDPGPRPTGFMNDIVVDSDDGSVYVASGPYQSSGVFRSADDGAHWTPLLRVSPSAVAIDPSDRRVLY